MNLIMAMLYKLLLSIYLSILVISVSAEETTKILSKLSLEELMGIEVVVASKTTQKLSEAPSSVTVFTRRELLQMGITSIEELMNFVPGFQATREIVFNHGYMATGRGRSTSQASFNILFLLDGQRISNDISGGALTSNHFITLANVKQIEIIRGPGSALYGTGAFTGVVNIITATDVNDVFVGKGDLNSEEFYLNMSQHGDDWQASVFVRHFEDDGQQYAKIANMVDKNLNTKDPKDGDDVYLTYTWDDNFRVNIRHNKRQIEGFLINRTDENNAVYAFESQQNFIYFKYNLFNNTTNPLTLHASYLTTAELRTNIFQDTTLILSDLEESEWQFGLDQHYQFNDKHKLLAGMVWRNPTVDKARNNVSGKDERMISATGRNIIGIYLQDQYKVSDNIELTLGIRNDHYSNFGNTANPRAAMVYAINPKTRFKLMYGQAFRVPSFRQTSTIGFFVGNADIKPETVKTTEFAWLQEYSNTKTTLTLFHNEYKNKIDTVINSNNERFFTNTTDLDTNGLEFDIATTINNFNLRGTYTYLIDTEQEPRRIAKQTLSLITNYKLGVWNFNLNGFYHDEIEQDIRNNIIIHDGYWLWNNTIRYNFNKQLTLVSRINNLFDKEYYSSTKTQSFYEGIPNRGRTFFFGAEIVF